MHDQFEPPDAECITPSTPMPEMTQLSMRTRAQRPSTFTPFEPPCPLILRPRSTTIPAGALTDIPSLPENTDMPA